MATLRDIRNRIKGVQSTQKITKAMKMVAAAKLRRAQDNIISARPYAAKIKELFGNLITEDQKTSNPYFIESKEEKALVLVITADRGLCGAFNTNIIKEACRIIDEKIKPSGASASVYCVGKKGYEYFKKRGYDIAGFKVGLFQKLKFDTAKTVSNEIIQMFLSGKYDSVHVVFNEFKSVVSQQVTSQKYLPVPVQIDKVVKDTATDFIYEKDQLSIFEFTLPKFLNAQMWRYFLESNASEFGARMTAMENATTNAGELIRSLKVKYNKERQAAITKEILEIVSGANALNESNG